MTPRLAVLALAAVPAIAAAHPLGNFTINRYAAVHVEPRAIAVRYVLDMAEIPAFQEQRLIDADGDGLVDAAEREAYLVRLSAALAANLVLSIDGAQRAVVAGAHRLEMSPGVGGLPTLRVEAEYAAALDGTGGAVELRDGNYAGRPGWQEIVADSAPEVRLLDTTVPRVDRSQALRAYPADPLESPPQVTAARFRIATGNDGAEAGRAGAARTAAARPDRLAALIATTAPLGPGLVLTSLLVAVALGALHALAPGHGKTIVGAYLIGAHGTARHAVLLGLVVTATHTTGVYLLGLVTLTASHYIVPERLFPWLGAVSGLLVVGIGASLATARLQTAAGQHHHHGHGHEHRPPAAPGWRSLVALGVSGGLLPCPSALVVMLGAIAVGRIAFGLVLIVAFSAGLAAVLTAIGLALIRAHDLFERLPFDGRVARYAPVASAVLISIAGLAIVAQALARIGA